MTACTDFSSLEHHGWSSRAAIYDDYSARFCRQGVRPLLRSVDVCSGQVVLDVCCGTGDVSAAVGALGAEIVGLDFSETMIEVTAAKVPEATFRVGDAEPAIRRRAFDRVLNNFGMLHVSKPDLATA